MADLIDPTVTGNYPVILGDGLLGKTSNEIFTGIRYNHKPSLSASDARLKPSLPGKTTSYDLGFSERDGTFAFAGTRTTDDDDYVLWFDPDRKAFILDKVDSTFNMNLTRLPGNTDPEDLRRRHPHLSSGQTEKSSENKKSGTTKDKPKAAPKATAKNAASQNKETKRKLEKKQKMDLKLPVPAAPKPEEPKPRKKKDEDEDSEDDDDGDLLIEYPGAESGAKKADFSPAFPAPRRFDEFMNQRDSEADDADGESDSEPDMDFKLPSPVNHHHSHSQHSDPMDVDEQHEEPAHHDEDINLEDDLENALENDLEKEMENAFEELQNSGQDGSPDGDESEISEED